MTARERQILLRCAMFSAGPGVIAFGFGFNWWVIGGLVMFFSTIPGLVKQLKIDRF